MSPIKGIDVSTHQGEIDWKAVKNAGVKFAIVRIGYCIKMQKGLIFIHDEYKVNTFQNRWEKSLPLFLNTARAVMLSEDIRKTTYMPRPVLPRRQTAMLRELR